jgi:hypothetical protein
MLGFGLSASARSSGVYRMLGVAGGPAGCGWGRRGGAPRTGRRSREPEEEEEGRSRSPLLGGQRGGRKEGGHALPLSRDRSCDRGVPFVEQE